MIALIAIFRETLKTIKLKADNPSCDHTNNVSFIYSFMYLELSCWNCFQLCPSPGLSTSRSFLIKPSRNCLQKCSKKITPINRSTKDISWVYNLISKLPQRVNINEYNNKTTYKVLRTHLFYNESIHSNW